jgi:sugar phosphate isomerase/epimerase
MELKVFKCLWGVARIDEETFAGFKKAGYDGIECKGIQAREYRELPAWLKKYGFDFIAQIHPEGQTVEEHLASFDSLMNASLPLNPVFINSQSGCDHWSMADKHRFIGAVLKREEQYGISIAHETHRSRIFYTPWDTSAIIDAFPTLKLCCDLSHWVNVCERLLTTEGQHVDKAASAALHLHARVGYQQGPQVPDPRAPEYNDQLEAHEKWWKTIWESQHKRGMKISTVCPEYGPPLYQHTMPFTHEPVANPTEISEWAMHRLREQFAAIYE